MKAREAYHWQLGLLVEVSSEVVQSRNQYRTFRYRNRPIQLWSIGLHRSRTTRRAGEEPASFLLGSLEQSNCESHSQQEKRGWHDDTRRGSRGSPSPSEEDEEGGLPHWTAAFSEGTHWPVRSLAMDSWRRRRMRGCSW